MPKTHVCGWRYSKMSFQLALVVALLAEISRNCKFCILAGHFIETFFRYDIWNVDYYILFFHFLFQWLSSKTDNVGESVLLGDLQITPEKS